MLLIQLSKPDKPTVPQVYAMTLVAYYNTLDNRLEITPKELFITLRRQASDMIIGDPLLHQEHILAFSDTDLEFSITSIHNDSTLTIKSL